MKISIRLAALLFAGVLAAFLLVSITAAQRPKALLLFGGQDHKTFLGCLNCAVHSAESICNEYGKYGSQYESSSIWNQYGTYGSQYNKDSPWSAYTTSAPIIVDQDGGSYGYFSANAYHTDRTRIGWLLAVLDYYEKSSDLEKTRTMMCTD
jgi:hypothetical protein